MINLQDMLINEDASLLKTMQDLDRGARKILFITREDKLIAAITDGDIRRWILKHGNLDAKVRDMANYQPKFLRDSERASASEYMKAHLIEALPIVDQDRKIVSVIFWNEETTEPLSKLDLPVVIMAGGLGTRLFPYTKILPKPLIPIGDIPIAEHIIQRFRRFGCDHFYMIVNHKKNMIKAYFNDTEKDYHLAYVDEDKPLGTGGGLSLLKGLVSKPFFLTNCDILIDENYEKIYRYHQQAGNLITMVCSLKTIKIPYGVIELGPNGEIANMKEKPEISFFTNTGCYIVDPSVIESLVLDESIGFPDVIERHRQAGQKIGVYPISEQAWMDMGELDQMEDMRRRLQGDES